MSEYYALVCHEKKTRLQVGQGWGAMDAFYTTAPHEQMVRSFLNAHINMQIEFVCMDRRDSIYEYDDWEERFEAFLIQDDVTPPPADIHHPPGKIG
jgi:hypothetical protein